MLKIGRHRINNARNGGPGNARQCRRGIGVSADSGKLSGGIAALGNVSASSGRIGVGVKRRRNHRRKRARGSSSAAGEMTEAWLSAPRASHERYAGIRASSAKTAIIANARQYLSPRYGRHVMQRRRRA